MQYNIGCSGFYNKDWKAVFYPEDLAQKKWFEYYCSRFNTLELNTTFYRFPKPEFLKKWYNESPEHFIFSVKAPRLITHYKQFNDCVRLMNDFYTAVNDGLHEKLGPVLFQLPARIIYSEDILQRIIESLNNTFVNVVEFRNISWWNEDVFNQLAEHNICFCGESIKNLPDDIITNTSTIYYRFHGIKKLYYSQYPLSTIKKFAADLKQKAENKTAYIYFNNTATIAAVNNAMQLEKLLA